MVFKSPRRRNILFVFFRRIITWIFKILENSQKLENLLKTWILEKIQDFGAFDVYRISRDSVQIEKFTDFPRINKATTVQSAKNFKREEEITAIEPLCE